MYQIPVPSYIKKYIDKELGSPIFLTEKNSQHIAIRAMMTTGINVHNLYSQFIFQEIKKQPRTLPTAIQLNSPFENFIDPSPRATMMLQCYFENLFLEALHKYHQLHEKPGRYKDYHVNIETFLNWYGIYLEVDITTDCIIKKYYRYREQITRDISAEICMKVQKEHFKKESFKKQLFSLF